MTDTPQVLLAHHLKTLKLPTFLREYDKLARQCATEGADHVRYLVRLTELELIDRERRMVERRIRQARFPAVKSLDSFDFKAIASLNKMLVLELARCEYVERCENIIALGNSGTGKTHIALGLGLAACQKGLSVGFLTAAALVHELMEARDEKRLLRLQKQLAKYHLLIIDELGFVPLSKTGAELLFEVFSQRYERGSILVTSNLPFDEWTEIFGSERLTGALLEEVRDQVRNVTRMQRLRTCAAWRPDTVGYRDPVVATKLSLKSLARRILDINDEIAELDRFIVPLVEELAPSLLELEGVGTENAGAVMVAVGGNPDRLRSEASFAMMCGVCPIPASSGKTQRHRLNRGGNRQANSALHMVVVCRMRTDERTRAYVARRTLEGLSKREIMRCLKRYVAREIYRVLTAPLSA